MSNIVEPALQSCCANDQDKPVSEEVFLTEFKRIAECVAQRLKEQPVIVAHSENTFDGSGIKRLLSNKFELEKVRIPANTHLFSHSLITWHCWVFKMLGCKRIENCSAKNENAWFQLVAAYYN